MNSPYHRTFPKFSLARLLRTVFDPQPGERIAILIDLPNPRMVQAFTFLQEEHLTIQRYAFDVFHLGLTEGGVMKELGLKGGDFFAYELTGGSNLDLPETAIEPNGDTVNLEENVYRCYDIILCISTFSATAPLTAMAKKHGFRGATLHGVNKVILETGLSVDYNEVSREAEKLRLAMTRADWVEIDYVVNGEDENKPLATCTLHLHLNGQEAQKSHGMCRGKIPDVANLPAGEVYFVPEGAEGQFPMRYEDGTLGIMNVSGGRITSADLLKGSAETVAAHNVKLKSDPVTGELGELGFGTQDLPASGRDIQDEKILGTLHVATGRSDHLGGHLTPELFANKKNATHDDILFSPTKTPQINVPQVRMHRDGVTHVVLENYTVAPYLAKAMGIPEGETAGAGVIAAAAKAGALAGVA
ncbi:MAG: hypothetical protein ACAI35_05245 [Candidatus Methylacidiphilales bacterium]|nr:hypothetical protein [Candidatus Methylacidiphilales bacterium]